MKKKFTVYSLQFTAVVFLLLTVSNQLPSIQAASPSPSPNALSDFQKKVENIKKDAASKAAEIKKDVSQKVQNKAFIGTVTGVNGKQLTLQSAKGLRTINTDEYTAFQDSSKKIFSLKDIKKDDYLITLGDVDDAQNLKAKKVIRAQPPTLQEKYVVWGEVQSILTGTITLLKSDNQKVSVQTDANTAFRLGSDEAQLTNLKPNNFISEGKNLFIISVGSKLTAQSTNSKFIYILNPKGDLKIEKNASASATPSVYPVPTGTGASPKVKN